MSKKQQELLIHFDGGSRGNPGPAGAGVVIIDSAADAPLFEAGFFLGTQTNNVAEYMGLLHALEHAQAFGKVRLQLRSDSELLVRQLTGEYRVKNPALAKLYEEAQRRLLKFDRWQVQHVRREFNSRADQLANLAMDKRQTVIVLGQAADPGAAAPPAGETGETTADASSAKPAAQAAAKRPATPPLESTAPHDDRRVLVSCSSPPQACPAGKPFEGERVEVGVQVPAGVCVFAAHALLPTVLAIRNTEAGEVAQVPTLTVRCTHPDCRAAFRVGPRPPTNGHA